MPGRRAGRLPRPGPLTLGFGRRVALLLAATVTVVACSSSAPAAAPGPTAQDGTTAAARASTTTATTAAGCSPARRASDGVRTVQDQGLARTYAIAFPAGYDGTVATPLLFDFHGWAGTKEQQEVNTRLAARGTKQGFIVVTPDAEIANGTIREWNLFGAAGRPDDFTYVHTLIDGLKADLCIDPARVYAAGHSNGSAFTGFLACTPPYVFAAVAMVSATTPAGCPAGVAPAVLAIAGTKDPQVPFGGGSVGGGSTRIPGVTDVVDRYVSHYHCGPSPVVDALAPGVERSSYGHCDDGADVVLIAVEGGTHPWPGGPAAAADPSDSAAGKAFDATGAVLTFFTDHRRRPGGT